MPPAFFNPEFVFRVGRVRIETENLHLALVLRVIVWWELETITDQYISPNFFENGGRTMPCCGGRSTQSPSERFGEGIDGDGHAQGVTRATRFLSEGPSAHFGIAEF